MLAYSQCYLRCIVAQGPTAGSIARLPSEDSISRNSILWMQREKECLADSKIVAFVVSKNLTHRPDVIAGINSNLTNRSNSGDSGINQQSQVKRIVRIQVSKREFTGYQP
jgi:hypothetical protein